MKKLITIIIPTYNMEKYLRKCLDSLIVSDKNMLLLEVLVINDGSKDSSSIIAHEYESRYPQTFKVIDKENGNYGSCINRGLKVATGKYIKVLDADDWFDTEEFEKYIHYLTKTNCDLIITDCSHIYNNKKITQFNYPFKCNYIYNQDLIQSNDFSNMKMHVITYRKSILEDCNYKQTEGISYTDQEWIFYPIKEVKSIIYFKCNVYQYLLGREGQTMDANVIIKNISHQILILQKMIDTYSKISVNTTDSFYIYYKFRIFKLLRSVYKIFLLSLTNIKLKELDDFDNYIKEHNYSIYNTLDNIIIHKYFPFKFIKYYHKKNKKPHFIILYINSILKKLQAVI